MQKFNRIDYLFNDQGMQLEPGSILIRENRRLFGPNLNNFALFNTIYNNPPDIARFNNIEVGQPQNAVLQTANYIQFALGGAVGNILQNNTAKITFKNKNSAVIIYREGTTNSLIYGNLNNQLAQYWHDQNLVRNYKNMFIVSEVVFTNQAKVVYSQQNKTSITLTHSMNNGVFVNIPDDLIDMNVNLALNARSVSAREFGLNTPLLFKLIRWNPQQQAFQPFHLG